MKKGSIIYSIIDSFMHHENPSEIVSQFFRRWLIDDADREEKDRALEDQWNRMNTVLDAIDAPDGLQKQYDVLEHAVKSKARKGSYVPWMVAAAAGVLLCLSVSWNYFSMRNLSGETICYVSGKESKGEFSLPDGSHVWLNANSSLQYNSCFSTSDERRVTVVGEAFFDVVKGKRPFVVSLGDDVDVKVHGTRFNVRNADIFESVQVVLQSGEVEIINGSYRAKLAPGTCYTYSQAMETYSISYVNTANFSNWTKPLVVFKDETLSDILTTLEHWYNVRITVEKGIDTTLSLSFTLKNEPVHDTFSLLQTLTGYRCSVIDKDHIVISK